MRRTQSSLSHTSSGVSDKLSPLGHTLARRFLERNVAAQDAIAQEPETAQIREARSLGEPRQHRQMKWRGEAPDRQIDVDAPFQLGSRRVLEPTARFTAER